MGNLSHSPKNDNRYSDLMKDVRQYGRDSASGRDSLPKMGLKVLRAASDGVIDLEKGADDLDEAARIYNAYAESDSNKAIHEHTTNGLKANISKVRTFIKAGMLTTCDPVTTLDQAVVLRKRMSDAGEKVKSAYPAYIDVCRMMIESDTPLSDEQIMSSLRKPEPAEKTVEKELKRAGKILENLISGDKGVQDQSEEVVKAHEYVQSRLARMVAVNELTEFKAKAASLGFEVSIGLNDRVRFDAIAAE